MNKQHLHSTTTIQLHLTITDYQRICQNPASEFFLNKRARIYARGLQQERFSVLLNNSDSRPSNSLFQIARGSGATLSECTFFLEKSARHQEDFYKTNHFKDSCQKEPGPSNIRVLFDKKLGRGIRTISRQDPLASCSK